MWILWILYVYIHIFVHTHVYYTYIHVNIHTYILTHIRTYIEDRDKWIFPHLRLYKVLVCRVDHVPKNRDCGKGWFSPKISSPRISSATFVPTPSHYSDLVKQYSLHSYTRFLITCIPCPYGSVELSWGWPV